MKKKIILTLSLFLLGMVGCSDFTNPLSSETSQVISSGGNENGSGGNENG